MLIKMLFWIEILLTQAFGLEIACNLNECLPINQGNGICNSNCMSASCNFDIGGIYTDSSLVQKSDCLDDCFMGKWWYCSASILGDGICDEGCNFLECGWDFGDCGYCAPSCYKSQLGGSCDLECNTTECFYDAGACLECSLGCTADIWGDGICNQECNNKECNYDNGDCLNVTCAPNCYLWMIDNGYCDEACHVAECNFDSFDCDCSPGCFSSFLGNGVCDEICDNRKCKFDNGDCGYCVTGCFLDMLNNGVCDDICNNFDCKYDYYDCGCAPGCNPEDYGKCKPECLVNICKYDQMAKSDGIWCDNKDLVLYIMFQHIIFNDTNHIARFDDCLVASNYQCTFAKYSDPTNNYNECIYRECNYGMTIDKFEDCYSKVPDQDIVLCHSCYSNNIWSACDGCQFASYYDSYSMSLFGIEFRLIPNLYRLEGYQDFTIIYASSIQSGSTPSGKGTHVSPFETFEFALEYLYNFPTQVSILYLANDGNYTWPHSNLLNYMRDLSVYSSDNNKVVIRVNGWSEYSCYLGGNIKFENVIFDGSEQYFACDDSIYCEYCAYMVYNESDGYYYNDRNESITQNFQIDKCEKENSYALSFFHITGTLTLLNVEIKNFRFNYDSIISNSEGILNLFNVSFDNIGLRGKEATAVIDTSGNGLTINYIGGSVTRLNNGYEIDDPMDFPGFLYVGSRSSVLIKNVDFKYNIVHKRPQSSLLSASLIYIGEQSDTEINNCTFMYNYCEDGLIYSNLKITNYDAIYNETYYMTALLQKFLYVHDTKFISNYGNLGIIHVGLLGKLLNIHLCNLVFESNGAENDSIVYLSNPQILDEYKTQTEHDIIINSKTIEVAMPPRWCNLSSILFKNNYAKGILNTTNMVNFQITNFTIDSNGYPNEDKNINTLVLDYFIENRQIENLYIRKKKADQQAPDCDFIASLSNSYNLDIRILNISNNICRKSSPTFKIINSDSNDLEDINCFGNTGSGLLPTCLYLTGPYNRSLTSSNFIGNANYAPSGYGPFGVDSQNELYISNCLFLNNSAGWSSALYFSGYSIYINSTTFELNKSKKGSGGGLYFISKPSSSKRLMVITSSNFNQNSANLYGGGIYVDEKSISPLPLELVISETIFKENQASYGSALYIDNSVALVESSEVTNTNFTENNSKESGTVSLYFYSGILSFKSCNFIENASTYGAALHIDTTQDKIDARSKTIIESSTFRNNTGNSIIFVDNQNRNSSIETKNCLFEYNSGIAVSLNYDYFIDNGSIFRYNSAPFGSCFYLQNSAILYSSSQFFNNTSDDYGGVIAINFKSIFNCDSCTFSQNKAIAGNGGVLDAEQDSLFLISNSNFFKNSCGSDGSAIFAFNCNSTASSILASNFSNNNANSAGVITLISSKLFIYSSNVDNNSAKGYASGVKLSFSHAEIYDSKFSNQSSIYGNFIYLQAESSIKLKNAAFYNGNSDDNGGAIYSSSSMVSIDSCIFDKLSSPKGGAIYAIFDSTIIVKNSDFKQLTSSSAGGIINANHAILSIENSNFREYSSTGIYGKQLKSLEISNSIFSNGIGLDGGAINCQSCNKINIKLCSFTDNSATVYGGALFLDSNNEITDYYNIFSCKFTNNKAENGGAIFTSDVSLNISSSVFQQNKATTDTDNAKIEYGIGGGIRMGCPNFQSCKFNIQSNNFVENYAKYNGGALSWDNKLPDFFNNSYQSNSALYGNDIASFPIKLMRINENGTLEDYGNERRLTGSISSSNLTGVASGQNVKTPLCVALVDDLDNIITTDNVSEAELTSVNTSTKISGKTKVKAINGIFNFSEFVISEEPGSDIQIAVISSAIDATKIKKSGEIFYSQSLTFNVNVRKCQIGEVTSGQNCEVCPAGFYSLNPDLISCLTCPDTAICYGNYSIVPKPGYWRDNLHTDKFWKCPHPAACLGSPDKSNIFYTGECGEAYQGNKCQSCKPGYSHASGGKCEECPSVTVNIITTIGVSIALIIVLFILVKATRKSAFRQKSHASIYIKIFLNYIQMVILASTFKLSWSDEVKELFKAQNNADYVYQQIYSFQCLFHNEKSQNLIYFRILIIVGLLPVLIIILSLLFWTIIKLIKKSYKTFWDDFISTCIILLFLIHPSIVKKMFSSMNCSEINSGEYWIEEDLDIRCWDYEHIFYVLTVSLPSIILWGIILPTICLENMIKNRKSLNEINIRLRFGFLFNGYKEEHFYWEFIILYSKILLICCSVFLTRISIKLQALIVAILYSIYLRLQYSNNPYTEYNLNQMELRAKLVCVVTIYSGLYYLMGSLSASASLFFFIIIVIANIYFIVYWAFYLLKSLFSAISKKVNYIRSRRQIQSESAVRSSRSGLEESKLVSRSVNLSISNDNLLNESQFPAENANIDKENVEESQKLSVVSNPTA